MARSALFLIAAFMVAFAAAENVQVLTASNFDDVVSGNEFVLVEFYAPWCGHCKSLAPEYEKAATALKDRENVVLANVDATEDRELGERFGVSGFPTLKFFRSGNPMDYDGPRKADGIVNWVLKKSGPATSPITSKADLEKMTDNFDVVVVGAFNDADTDAKDAFTQAALAEDAITFAMVENNDALAKELGMTVPSVYIHKNFDDGRADFTGDMNEDDIAAFVAANKLPLVIPFTNEKSSDIFGSDVKVHLLMFSDDEQKDTHAALVDAATLVAKEYQGQALFVTVATEHNRIMEFFGIEEGDLPTMRLVSMGGQMRKYSPSGTTMDGAAIAAFMKSYFDGELKPELKSEDVPESQDGGAYVLVGKSFDDVVINNDKDVLVEFYAPWCGHCKSLAPIYDGLADKFAHIDSVVIAKMDATANEHEAVEVEGFPTIKFWKSGAKDSPMDYNGSRDEDGFVEFLKENAGVAFDLDAAAPAGEDEDSKEEL